MSSIILEEDHSNEEKSEINITTRRPVKQAKVNMEKSLTGSSTARDRGSLLIDTILSQDEFKDVYKMLDMEDELHRGRFPFTSTQMKRETSHNPALSVSPITARGSFAGEIGGNTIMHNNKFAMLNDQMDLDYEDDSLIAALNTHMKNAENKERYGFAAREAVDGLAGPLDNPENSAGREAVQGSGEQPANRGVSDCHQSDPTGISEGLGDGGRALNSLVSESDRGRWAMQGSGTTAHVSDETGLGNAEESTGGGKPLLGEGQNNNNNIGGDGDGKRMGSSPAVPVEEDESDNETNNDGKGEKGPAIDLLKIMNKLDKVEGLLGRIDERATKATSTVKELQVSLEYSQQEIDNLKAENLGLKKKMAELEFEDRRTEYQVKKVEEKIDRVETAGKKKNLIFEGILEADGGKEDVDKTLWHIFDQMKLNKGIDIDSCYRVGPYNKNRSRPINVSFMRQSDRDLVYSVRMELRRTKEYKQVWVNEDIGQLSKKTRNMIRLITKQAQADGIDCRTGKYAIYIDRKRYDKTNLNELPTPLHPSSIKQIQIDDSTIAYQSEEAPFSNFYPACFTLGKQGFVCNEQAYQYLRAKTLDRPLAATRMLLSRDPVEMKKIGDGLGTSDAWEARKFDVMYMGLKAKFEQNQDLKTMLLKTGKCELVEATPDRLWGCGATLSSNILRRHEWPGDNKQGKILMVVREELRRDLECAT